MAGPRREKVSDLVREEVARLLQAEVHDVRLGFITVTDVTMSPDLKHARVYVSMLAEGEPRENAMMALKAASGFIRRRIGQTLRLRHTPQISFALDTSIEYGARIESLIQEARSLSPPSDPTAAENDLPAAQQKDDDEAKR
ncbi:MAG TPA: 30S ribosome-binding factor RbfA [Patescibacteria group bacterium]|jgi:ribosome-binding factor A|nr:30S ribosome-binding factor RbfA [Patescibacteria group bacterium]